MGTSGDATKAQKIVLVMLAAVFVLLISRRFVVPTVQRWAASWDAGTSVERVKIRRVADKQILDVHVDALRPNVGAYTPTRNLFRYGVIEPKIEPIDDEPIPEEPVEEEETQDEQVEESGPPELEMGLLGVFGPRHRRIAVLSNGQEIINVLQGDVLDEQFIVHEISPLSVGFRYVDFPTLESRLGLGG